MHWTPFPPSFSHHWPWAWRSHHLVLMNFRQVVLFFTFPSLLLLDSFFAWKYFQNWKKILDSDVSEFNFCFLGCLHFCFFKVLHNNHKCCSSSSVSCSGVKNSIKHDSETQQSKVHALMGNFKTPEQTSKGRYARPTFKKKTCHTTLTCINILLT